MTTETAPARSGLRLTADERRRAVVAIAVHAFARGGYHGTSTEVIAQRAGISQPYLFRLFGTKRDLFIATVNSAFDRAEACFTEAAAGRSGADALAAMGLAYGSYLEDADLLLLQLHAYAAAEDPVIRAAVAGRFASLARHIDDLAGGVGPEELRAFFGTGMLLNVAVALDLQRLPELFSGFECGPSIRGPAD